METSDPWIELSRDDFLEAIKRLKPGRMLKSYHAKELQIGLDNGEAIFCIEGAITRRSAQGAWNGFACISYGMLLPYLKVKPETERVRLVFDQGRLKIGTARFQARWIGASHGCGSCSHAWKETQTQTSLSAVEQIGGTNAKNR